MDDWFSLTLKYRDYHQVSSSLLNDYGYMAVMDYVDTNSPRTILEFGHGFNPTIFQRYGTTREVWGIDDCQGLSYFPGNGEQWETQFDKNVRAKAPTCTYKRGLLGRDCRAELPENYFDVICSVSVLEEIPIEAVQDVMCHAARLLKPGGALIGTHDLPIIRPARLEQYVAAHATAGLELQAMIPEIKWPSHMLLENPTSAMLYYLHSEGDNRKYTGHWTTIWTVAKKGN